MALDYADDYLSGSKIENGGLSFSQSDGLSFHTDNDLQRFKRQEGECQRQMTEWKSKMTLNTAG